MAAAASDEKAPESGNEVNKETKSNGLPQTEDEYKTLCQDIEEMESKTMKDVTDNEGVKKILTEFENKNDVKTPKDAYQLNQFNKLHKIDVTVTHDDLSQEWKKWENFLTKLSLMKELKIKYESSKPYNGEYNKQTMLKMYSKYSSENLENNETFSLSSNDKNDKNKSNNSKNEYKLGDDSKENEERKLKIQEQFYQWCQKNYGIMDRTKFMDIYQILFLTEKEIEQLKTQEKENEKQRTQTGQKAKKKGRKNVMDKYKKAVKK